MRRRRIIVTGDVPSPSSPPLGCHFNTRCWLRERLGNPEVCAKDDPPFRDVGGGHLAACHFSEEISPEVVAQATGLATA